PSGFSFNQYLIVDDEPFLFHTGPRRMFPLISEAIGKVVPLEKLRYIGFSHFESDECGSLNEFLAVASHAQPVCSKIAAMTSINDMADRPPKVLMDQERLELGKHTVRWFDTPHLPHGWESGLLFDELTATLFCGDLFTQPGSGFDAVTESDILAPSEKLRKSLDYFSHSSKTAPMLRRLADARPKLMACMHGSAWRGDGAALLQELISVLN
ncbi:MAG: MBL fold metallo-hydrolase, partial [Cyanobacteria bacterium]|nr:MBL fold metallo-hydrolase [Cyanobacteriota bacterium]